MGGRFETAAQGAAKALIQQYLDEHDLDAEWHLALPEAGTDGADNLVQTQINAGNPLIADTYLPGEGFGHYVVIVGYEWVGSTFYYLVNDPFGLAKYTTGYNIDPKTGCAEYGESPQDLQSLGLTAQPQVYTYGQMDLGNADGTRGLLTIQSTIGQDTAPPTVSTYSAANVTTGGGTTETFTVTYADNVVVDDNTLDSSNVRVTGPNGYNQAATFIGVDGNINAPTRTATYQGHRAGRDVGPDETTERTAWSFSLARWATLAGTTWRRRQRVPLR